MNESSGISPTVLEGEYVRLEPLDQRHARNLAMHANLDLFRYFGATRPPTADEEGLVAYVDAVNKLEKVVPFATVLQASGEAVGSTTFMDIRAENLGLEIGMTWIVAPHQGTMVNPEAKYLMLQHAFEVLGYERVQLKCDARNQQSQAGILKLGAVFEGTLRRHMVLPDGFVRDTMMFSIISDEWPSVKAGLQRRLKG